MRGVSSLAQVKGRSMWLCSADHSAGRLQGKLFGCSVLLSVCVFSDRLTVFLVYNNRVRKILRELNATDTVLHYERLSLLFLPS
jgi:hypothetical protein